MTDPKFVKRKKPNYKKAILLFIILIVALFLFYNIEGILEGFYSTD